MLEIHSACEKRDAVGNGLWFEVMFLLLPAAFATAYTYIALTVQLPSFGPRSLTLNLVN